MIAIIGLGEIGEAVLREIAKKRKDVMGVDIKRDKITRLKKEGFNAQNSIPKSKVYIISVYSTEEVLEVINCLDYTKKPLVIIESTIKPGTIKKIKNFKDKRNLNFNLALFPHRYNPNDPKHHIFNLDRILGGLTEECAQRALEFYINFMDKKFIHVFPVEIVEICKLVENAYRFIEITVAEEIKMLCDKKSIDFDELRKAANTKWNTEIKEARSGIKGKCLLKDASILNQFFEDNKLLNYAIKIDKKYKETKRKI